MSQEGERPAREAAEWTGRITGRSEPVNCPVLALAIPHDRTKGGGSQPFLAVDGEGRRWYVKPLNNGQSPRVTVNEYIVARVGRLIGAPVCDVAIVKIPPELAGQKYSDHRLIEAGLAHGSREIPAAHHEGSLGHRAKDENRIRHAGVFALHDWCWGGDNQWLYQTNDDMRLFSHDHGHYFPSGPQWTKDSLLQAVDQAHSLGQPRDDIDPAEFERLARSLEEIQQDTLVGVLSGVPASWPVSNDELETMGFFLFRRAPAVAGRLRTIAGGAA